MQSVLAGRQFVEDGGHLDLENPRLRLRVDDPRARESGEHHELRRGLGVEEAYLVLLVGSSIVSKECSIFVDFEEANIRFWISVDALFWNVAAEDSSILNATFGVPRAPIYPCILKKAVSVLIPDCMSGGEYEFRASNCDQSAR